MKVKIEIWQNKFNSEWNCDITTSIGSQDETEHWAVEDFCTLLNLFDEKFSGAKCIVSENKSCDHGFEAIPDSYDVRTCSYKARCYKCGFIPE